MILKFRILSLLSLFACMLSLAQTATIRGFVYEEKSHEPIIFANVILEGTTTGAVTDDNGFFTFANIAAGEYVVRASFVGYAEEKITVTVEEGKISSLKFYLNEGEVLDAVELTAESSEKKVNVNTSVVKLTAKKIKRLPSVGGEPDIAQYLQVLPGVVFTGDQGGQLYIRGGAPIHNKVLLDGMIVYNPFHSIGFFSVFDTDIIKTADVYTGGFGVEYGGRVSSIIDIKTRDGNKKRISGKVGANTFGSKLLLEGPLFGLKENGSGSSFVFSGKTSYLDRTSDGIYSGVVEEGLPYSFTDVYSKISFSGGNGSKFNLFGFNFQDRVTFQNSVDYAWDATGFGSSFVMVPSSSAVLVEGNFAYSNYKITQTDFEQNSNGDFIALDPKSSEIDGFNLNLGIVNYLKGDNQVKFGMEVIGFGTDFRFTTSGGVDIEQTDNTTELAGYMKYKLVSKNLRWLVEPGIRVHSYTALGETTIEPRFGMKYNATDKLRFKASGGLYSQNLMSTDGGRDVVSLFNGFLSSSQDIPDEFRGGSVNTFLQKAQHIIVGFEYDVSSKFDINIEGYIKDFTQLVNLNKNKVYEDNAENNAIEDYLKKDFVVEQGVAQGIDVLLKYTEGKFSLWTTYSLGMVTNKDEIQEYHPHYDRRHNINVVGSYVTGKKDSWAIDVRWNYGSGFPFSQTAGTYETLDLSGGIDGNFQGGNGDPGTIFGALDSGRLPTYHRMDVSVTKTFTFSDTSSLDANISIANLYNRENIFYFDRSTKERVNQLPFLPSFGMVWSF